VTLLSLCKELKIVKPIKTTEQQRNLQKKMFPAFQGNAPVYYGSRYIMASNLVSQQTALQGNADLSRVIQVPMAHPNILNFIAGLTLHHDHFFFF
jgi:hypothetical protein